MEKTMTIQKISAIAGAALLAGGLLASAVAQAQPAPQRYDDRSPPMRPDHRPPPPPPPRAVVPQRPPMAVGRALPRDYRGYNYRVDNWQRYRLPRPRRGQYWVQYGPQFLLVNPAGVVLQVFVP
jgi:Ni/Co efflux regulator RcnB